MSFCTWFVELFYGKKEVGTIAGTEELKPAPETFCRSNRRDEWVKRIGTDMHATGADLLSISTPGNEDRYRGVIQHGEFAIWDTVTLEEVELATLWSNGQARGYYRSSREVEDYRDRHNSQRKMMKDHEVVAGFTNQVSYCRGMYGSINIGLSRHLHDLMGINLGHLQMVMAFNTDKRYRLYTLPDGTSLYRTVEQVAKNGAIPGSTKLCEFSTETGETRSYYGWILHNLKTAQLVDADGNDAVLEDPIRFIPLADGEDVGHEAYIYLVEGVANTYTRDRYRIEVDSERIYSNKIVAVDALLEAIWHRMGWLHIPDKGKIFIDNIRYMRLDGTVHTADVGGFLSIGAEAFRAGRKRAGLHHGSHGHSYDTGPLIMTHVDFPQEPIY